MRKLRCVLDACNASFLSCYRFCTLCNCAPIVWTCRICFTFISRDCYSLLIFSCIDANFFFSLNMLNNLAQFSPHHVFVLHKTNIYLFIFKMCFYSLVLSALALWILWERECVCVCVCPPLPCFQPPISPPKLECMSFTGENSMGPHAGKFPFSQGESNQCCLIWEVHLTPQLKSYTVNLWHPNFCFQDMHACRAELFLS